jgi:hypothetical protein
LIGAPTNDGGRAGPAELSEQEKAACEQEQAFFTMGRGYFIEQATRPQTIGHSLADSPVGLAAWMIDHDARSHELIASVFAGRPAGLTRDDILDNITLYWLTDTGASAARLYWENAHIVYKEEVSLPAAFTVFPDETFRAPRSWASRLAGHQTSASYARSQVLFGRCHLAVSSTAPRFTTKNVIATERCRYWDRARGR